jgi:tRNA nucleotidyltransferase (CCA-adding enzyme)
MLEKHLELCRKIKDIGGQPYVVGGYVRDLLMGRQSSDVDIVVVGLAEDFRSAWRKLIDAFPGSGVSVVGNKFPVFIINETEIALARTEKKAGPGHKGFVWTADNVTLKDDLGRRDLTVNAMAMDPFTNEIIDPFNGKEDIEDGVLTAVGPHFGEDPLRVMRAARFAAQLEMTIGENLVHESSKVLNELQSLSGERVWMELTKALASNKPSRFFRALDKLQALSILFPEIDNLKGRVQPPQYHPEGDAYVHTLLVIDRARELGGDPETMFAAMCHDLGKAVTDDYNLPHHYNHEALGVPLVHKVCDRLKAPNSFRVAAAMTAKEHLNIHRFSGLKPTKKVRLLTRLNAIQDDTLLRRIALASQADAQGRGPNLIDKPYPSRDNVIKAAQIIRGVRGYKFAHLKDGKVIAQKIEQERAKVLKQAGF